MPGRLEPDVQAKLDAGLQALALPADLAAPLADFLALLLRWSRAYNLTAVRDPAQMVTLHLLDSLSLHPHLDDILVLADLGSGAGLPGIPLALARPQLHIALVESNGKKARFLREVVRTLGLPNVEVAECRAEAFARPSEFDAITARALDSLAGIIAVGGHLLHDGGRVLAMKGAHPDAELAALPPGWQLLSVQPLRVPGLPAERHLVTLRRTRVSGPDGDHKPSPPGEAA
ncbi:MAG TPA: 16S rRNA (guanine(527)-N(7))-methyltransferase RsmG [Xanthomonadaceae bacterium]|nr:16S rRNA (guanine(527)-N(7))-methyltransferase RsmG [Xanthomonadaceae bacterium]